LVRLDVSGNPLDAKGQKILDQLEKNASGVTIKNECIF